MRKAIIDACATGRRYVVERFLTDLNVLVEHPPPPPYIRAPWL